MGGKLTSGGIKLPGTGDIEQTKIVKSVDGKEADEFGNIAIGGSFDYVSERTEISENRSLTRHSMRVEGLDDYMRYQREQTGTGTDFDDGRVTILDESLTMSSANGEYVYLAERNLFELDSAYYRSDNGGVTFSREKLDTEGFAVKLIRVSEFGQYVLMSTTSGRILYSDDYGKTWSVKVSSNADSSTTIAISRNGQNLLYPKVNGSLVLEVSGSEQDVALPQNLSVNDIKEIYVSDHSSIGSVRILFLYSNGNVYVSKVGGGSTNSFDLIASGASYISVSDNIDQIFMTKGTKIFSKGVDDQNFSEAIDTSTAPQFSDLATTTADYNLPSVFVSKDGQRIAALVITQEGKSYGGANLDYDSSDRNEDEYQPRYENIMQGVLFSDDGGSNWKLSRLKSGAGAISTIWEWTFYQFSPRLQLSDDFSSGYCAIPNYFREMLRVSSKSLTHLSSAKLIVDGGITLGQSLNTDNQYAQRLPGTIEYNPIRKEFSFHYNDQILNISQASGEANTPMVLVESSDFYGNTFRTIQPGTYLQNINTIETDNLFLKSTAIASGELLSCTNSFVHSSGYTGQDIGNLDVRVTALENVTQEMDDTSVEFFGARYHGGGAIQGDHEGYILVDKANQIRFMGNTRFNRDGDNKHSYNKYRVVSLPNHDPSDKITFTQLGRNNIYAITESGKCYISGYNGYGQCANQPTPSEPKDVVRNNNNIMSQVNHSSKIIKVVGGISNTYNTLFIDEDNILWGAGHNRYGYILGNNLGDVRSYNSDVIPSYRYSSGKQLVNIMTGVQDVHISGVYYHQGNIGHGTNYYHNHTVFALKTNGQVWTCGYNGYGNLGDGSTTARDEYLQVSGIGTVVKLKISTGLNAVSVYALNSAGQLWVWGYNYYGQLGTGDNLDKHSPVLSRSNVKDFWVSSGSNKPHAFVLGTDNILYSTGRNINGQLGLGDKTQRNTWTQVPLSSSISGNITDMCMAEQYCTWILYQDSSGRGKLLSCGYNGHGQLGLGDTTGRETFQPITHAPYDVKEIWATSYPGGFHLSSLHVKDSNSKLWVVGYPNYYIHDTGNRGRWILDRVKI
jgi:alpha-tubulin suppressor-like RCC1 family protein